MSLRFAFLFFSRLDLAPSKDVGTLRIHMYLFWINDDDSNSCITFHLRIANRLVTDSRCRGDIVNILGGCSRARILRPTCPTTLWRFHASTSNSPSGHWRPHKYTHVRYIYHIYAQQGIRVCEDDRVQLPLRQFRNPKALWLVRVSIWGTRDLISTFKTSGDIIAV